MKSEATAIFAPQDGRWKITVSFDGRRLVVRYLVRYLDIYLFYVYGLGSVTMALSLALQLIIIIDKTDAGLNGLCVRDITLICDVINKIK